jgi:hypothetical protein
MFDQMIEVPGKIVVIPMPWMSGGDRAQPAKEGDNREKAAGSGFHAAA